MDVQKLINLFVVTFIFMHCYTLCIRRSHDSIRVQGAHYDTSRRIRHVLCHTYLSRLEKQRNAAKCQQEVTCSCSRDSGKEREAIGYFSRQKWWILVALLFVSVDVPPIPFELITTVLWPSDSSNRAYKLFPPSSSTPTSQTPSATCVTATWRSRLTRMRMTPAGESLTNCLLRTEVRTQAVNNHQKYSQHCLHRRRLLRRGGAAAAVFALPAKHILDITLPSTYKSRRQTFQWQSHRRMRGTPQWFAKQTVLYELLFWEIFRSAVDILLNKSP